MQVDFHNFTGKHQVFLNGQKTYFSANYTERLVGYQRRLSIPGKDVYIQFRGNTVDCSVNGYYLDSGKKYKKIKGVPGWAWLFIIGCIAIPIVSVGGAIPILIGFTGATLSAKCSVQTNNNALNFFLSLGVTAVAWIVFFAFYIFMLSLMY